MSQQMTFDDWGRMAARMPPTTAEERPVCYYQFLSSYVKSLHRSYDSGEWADLCERIAAQCTADDIERFKEILVPLLAWLEYEVSDREARAEE